MRIRQSICCTLIEAKIRRHIHDKSEKEKKKKLTHKQNSQRIKMVIIIKLCLPVLSTPSALFAWRFPLAWKYLGNAFLKNNVPIRLIGPAWIGFGVVFVCSIFQHSSWFYFWVWFSFSIGLRFLDPTDFIFISATATTITSAAGSNSINSVIFRQGKNNA